MLLLCYSLSFSYFCYFWLLNDSIWHICKEEEEEEKKKAGKILVSLSAESVSLSSAVVSRPRVLPSLEELASLLSSMLISLSSSATR